jgi:hypothetical protein
MLFTVRHICRLFFGLGLRGVISKQDSVSHFCWLAKNCTCRQKFCILEIKEKCMHNIKGIVLPDYNWSSEKGLGHIDRSKVKKILKLNLISFVDAYI